MSRKKRRRRQARKPQSSPAAAEVQLANGLPGLLSGVVQWPSWERLLAADKPAVVSLLAANVMPLVGVLLLGWDLGTILPLYWAETLVIGVYAILRMLTARGGEGMEFGALPLFLIPFFCIHFGGFNAVHGMFLLTLFELAPSDDLFHPPGGDWPGPLVFIQLLLNVIRTMTGVLGWGGIVGVAALAVSHGISFARNYIGRGEYKTAVAPIEMIKPYGRIVLLHVCIIFGAFGVALFGSPLVILVLFVVMKLWVDLTVHLTVHARSQGKAGDRQTEEAAE